MKETLGTNKSVYSPQEHAQLSATLKKQLGPEFIAKRSGPGGSSVHYLEGWKAIALANEVLGFNGWSHSVTDITVDYVDMDGSKVSLGISALVRVTLKDGTYHEDIGYGSIENAKSKAAAFEKAKKEAITDGLKRGLKAFGNVLGNCLYDKSFLKKIGRIPTGGEKPLDPADLYRHESVRAAQAIGSNNVPVSIHQQQQKQQTQQQHHPKQQQPPNGPPQPSVTRPNGTHAPIKPQEPPNAHIQQPSVSVTMPPAQASFAIPTPVSRPGTDTSSDMYNFEDDSLLIAADLETMDASILQAVSRTEIQQQAHQVNASTIQPGPLPVNPPQRPSNLAPTVKPASHQATVNQENRILVNASPPSKPMPLSSVATTSHQELWTAASSLFQTTTACPENNLGKANEPLTHASEHRLSPAFHMPPQGAAGPYGPNRGQQYPGSRPLATRSATVRSSPRRVHPPHKRTSPYDKSDQTKMDKSHGEIPGFG